MDDPFVSTAAVPPGHVAFRFLCPVSEAGALIGKSGRIVDLIRRDTGTEIRIDELLADGEEPILLIVGPGCPKRKVRLSDEPHAFEADASPAQEALVRVFERVLEAEEKVSGRRWSSGLVTCRMLVTKSQVRRVMGKGGKRIQSFRKDSGAKIRAIPDGLPACAAPIDEIILLSGDVLAVKKAIISVSSCLQDDPPSWNPHIGVGESGIKCIATLADPQKEHSAVPILASTSANCINLSEANHPVPRVSDRLRIHDKKNAQNILFRLLCPNDRVGGVIGRGADIVKALEKETGAAISFSPPVPHSEERVITITSCENPVAQFSPAQNAVIRIFTRSIESGFERGVEVELQKGEPVIARLLVPTSQIGCIIGKGGAIIAETRRVTGASVRIFSGAQVPKCASEDDEVVQVLGNINSVQDALFHITNKLRDDIFQRKALHNTETKFSSYECSKIPLPGRVEDGMPGYHQSARPSCEPGHQNIHHLADRMDHLGVHNGDFISPSQLCTSQLSGDVVAVKKAIISVSSCIQDNPPSWNPHIDVGESGIKSIATSADLQKEHFANSISASTSANCINLSETNHPVPRVSGRMRTHDKKNAQDVLFRLLCPNDRVGGVIGRGAAIVKALEKETGAAIRLSPPVPHSDERVISITSCENLVAQFSPAQNAVIRIFTRSIESGIERGVDVGLEKGEPVMARLLVPSNQIGCIIGKGGAVIAETRRVTGASIRIFAGAEIPKCASEDDEVVQVLGKISSVQDALLHITNRLRDDIFKRKALYNTETMFSSYKCSKIPLPGVEDSTPGYHQFVRPSCEPGHQNINHLADRMDHLGVHNGDFISPSQLCTSQTVGDGNRKPITGHGRGSAVSEHGLELGSDSKTAIVTCTTVEIAVPDHCMQLVYGESGGNISRMRQISGAKVVVKDPLPEAGKGTVIISGTPDQTLAAQSLLQAFILSGQP